ncbi:hypothetical protein AVEN_209776-1 [Araneus ventricosus]|uniref:Uncharacterized protein n=1 Tax=Araneus ventricosus TaxID=182803 RepID=A0A4Y2VZ69_ARAVE|nr:hypothetical protein AVEN_209776-1 [Araneus ventricosus]
MSSSSLSEEDAIEYNMSEDLEDSPAVISPPPSSKPGKANKYKNRSTHEVAQCIDSLTTSGYMPDLRVHTWRQIRRFGGKADDFGGKRNFFGEKEDHELSTYFYWLHELSRDYVTSC